MREENAVLTKKKVIAWALTVLITLFVALWLNQTLVSSFDRFYREQLFDTVTLLSQSAPTEADEIDSWIKSLKTRYTHLSLSVIFGVPGFDELEFFHSSEGMKTFFIEQEPSRDFQRGVDYAFYQELYFSPIPYRIGTRDIQMVIAPIWDYTIFDLAGIAVFAFDLKAQKDYQGLILVLLLLIWGLFSVIYSIARFSRDPVLGYIILFLFAAVAVFVAYPLFEAIRLTFVDPQGYTFNNWIRVLQNTQYLRALWGSVQLGIFTATLSTLVGFLFAFVITRTAVKGKKFLTTMATLPVISPPFSLTLSIILLFGNNGLITRQLLGLTGFSIYGLGGLTIVQTMGMFPIAFLTMVGVLQAIDSTLEDAAMNLRASRLQTFLTVTLPLSVPGILSSWLLVFTNSLADFANPLLLGGSYRVLSVEAYLEVTGMNRLSNGAALSLLLLLPTLTAFLVQRFVVSKKSYVTVTGKPSARLNDLVSKPVKVVLVSMIVIICVFLISLYGTIVAGCFVRNWGIDYTFTLDNFREALQRGGKAIIDTVTLSAVATPIAGILAMLAALVIVRKKFWGKRLLEMLILTPFAIPGTLIGIAYILAFNKAPLILVGTAAIIVINYVIRELPVGVEGGVATLRQIDPAIEEAAQDLGANVPTIFRTIVLPLIRPAFISSMSYTFVRSMTAVSAIIFLISARWYHITVQIYNFSENLRFGLASVLATTLIVIVLAVFGLMRLLVRENKNLRKSISYK